jgi:hypothetical protein
VLFGEYSRAINEQAVKMIQTAQVKTGEAVEVYGVFSAWDIPQTFLILRQRKLFVWEDNNMQRQELVTSQPVD